MANGTSGQTGGGFRRPSRPSRGVTTGPTRAETVQQWGQTIAGQVRRGQHVLQQPTMTRPPQGLPYEKNGQKQPPHNFGGTRGLILRTVANDRGFEDTRFATERTARDYNEMHGDGDQVRGGVVKGRVADRGIAVPGQKGVDEPRQVMARVKLAEDGPNFDANGQKVDGKAGDWKRNAKGHIQEQLQVMEGQRRGQGQVVYFNAEDLRVPSLEPRAQSRPEGREYLLSDVMAKARQPVQGAPADSVDPAHQPLQVRESKDLSGRAELNLEQDVDLGGGKTAPEAYVLHVGPQDSFPSKEYHLGSVIHEVNRFHMCRDGNTDAIAVARAKPSERESMPEFGRSELAASAATMDRMTEVGYTWHPPQYSPENRRQVREAQAVQLEKPGGLDEVGQQANRTYRLSSGRAATAYEQRERNQERAQSVDRTNRDLLARQGERTPAPAASSQEQPAGTERRPAAPVGGAQAQEKTVDPAERAAAQLYDGKRKNVTDKTMEDLAAAGGETPTKGQVQRKLDELNQAAPPRTVAKQMEAGKSFSDVVTEARANQSQSQGQSQEAKPNWKDKVKSQFGIGDTPEAPPKAPAPAAGAAEAAQQRGQSKGRTRAPQK
ncbi:MAG: hypothetical protein F4018_17960 [Acidobacteria bacterium]|nr:hypothetical protein [Acidobacteriota bacterium]MYK90072.1 hypothetical protein [Acidobacteriota bacterium]